MKDNLKAVPKYAALITVTYKALKCLGGSGTNDEINEKGAELLELPDEILDIPHLGSTSLSEFNYRMAWARTLLKKYGAIINSTRSVWSITLDFANVDEVDGVMIDKTCHRAKSSKTSAKNEDATEVDGVEIPEEVRS